MHIAWHLVKVLPTIQRSITLPGFCWDSLFCQLCRQLNLPKLTLWSSMVTAKLWALPVISPTMLWSLPFPGPTTASSPLIHTLLWWASNLITSSTAQNTPSVLVLEKPGFSWGTCPLYLLKQMVFIIPKQMVFIIPNVNYLSIGRNTQNYPHSLLLPTPLFLYSFVKIPTFFVHMASTRPSFNLCSNYQIMTYFMEGSQLCL